MEKKLDLRGSSQAELETLCQTMQVEKFRAKQIADWIYRKGVTSLAEMHNLPGKVKEGLEKNAFLTEFQPLAVQKAVDGTTKFLWQLADGSTLETVLLSYTEQEQAKNRHTVCISTQIGCPMGCVFCATGLQGFVRNMTVGEIVSQILMINNTLRSTGEQVTNIVVMGMGEPLLNYRNTLKALHVLHDFLDISWRRITLSTCGIVPRILELADEELPLVLAISLHAGNDALRSKLMPINQKYPLAELLKACRHYGEKTGRRISFEYALLQGVNDSRQDADKLADLLQGIFCHVNLIPVNPSGDSTYSRPKKEVIRRFKDILAAKKIAASIREEKGTDILAACGQLRQKEAEQNEIRGRSGTLVGEKN